MNPYLSFNGNCREAMTFYQQCLGGNLWLQTTADSPGSEKLPAAMKNYIVHARLDNGSVSIMGSDMVEDAGLQTGNAVSLLLHCSSESEIRELFAKLSEGGAGTNPPVNTFWGGLSGNLRDKYGNHWLLHFDDRENLSP